MWRHAVYPGHFAATTPETGDTLPASLLRPVWTPVARANHWKGDLMRVTKSDPDDNVVQGLYEAAAGTTSWKVALAALDGAVGATSGSQLVVVDKADGKIVRSEQPDHTSPEGVLDYMREFHRFDPHVPYLVSRCVGEVVHTADVFPAAEYADHPFYREFWGPYNVRSFIGTKLAEELAAGRAHRAHAITRPSSLLCERNRARQPLSRSPHRGRAHLAVPAAYRGLGARRLVADGELSATYGASDPPATNPRRERARTGNA